VEVRKQEAISVQRFAKWSLIVLAGLMALLAVAITMTVGWRPILGPRARPLSNRVFDRTPERLARGKYLAEGVCGCMDCHSPHDWTQHDAPVPAGMEGAGEDMSALKGLPGRIVAPNLTPDPETGAGKWSDDALARAIREGVGHDGRALFPLMPYEGLRHLPDEDLASIVVFLRSLPPVRNPLPRTDIIFPVKYLIRSVPQPIFMPVPPPDLSNQVKRGEFLVRIAGCEDCHTPQANNEPIPGMRLAGGATLEGPWGRATSANLTPDPSGIPYYDETLFVQTIRTGVVRARTLNQIMPWYFYRNMTDEDLKAIFAYLRTITPVAHHVDNAEPPSYCPLDKTFHGGGNLNHAK
jgi:mono/diheme cytochrome c family protein